VIPKICKLVFPVIIIIFVAKFHRLFGANYFEKNNSHIFSLFFFLKKIGRKEILKFPKITHNLPGYEIFFTFIFGILPISLMVPIIIETFNSGSVMWWFHLILGVCFGVDFKIL
jgi:hypothetical protein